MSMSCEVSNSSGNCSESIKLLPKSFLSEDQQKAVTALYEKNCLLVARLGGGKTIIAATAITELLEEKQINRVLIVTTPKIANTVWPVEFKKWGHTQHVTLSIATGTPEQRMAAIKSTDQVCVITFNTLTWMKKEKLFGYFDGLLIDETTKLKESGGAGFKALRPHLKKFIWRAGLTGTPVNEDFLGLFGQIMLIDGGGSLGTRKDSFLNKFFFPTDYKKYNWELREGAEVQLLECIADLLHVMPDYRGELPPIEYHTETIIMPEPLSNYYHKMKKNMVTEDAISQSAAVLSQKLQQISSGFIYTETGDTVPLSNFRIEALKNLLDRIQGNTIIAYWYKEDFERLKTALPDAFELNPRNLTDIVNKWNAGDIKRLLVHPRSAGHGLQLEQGGADLVWYTPVWSNDLWEQTNARIWRKGQKNNVNIYTIEAEHSIDQVMSLRVESKGQFDKLFNEHLGE